MISTRMECISFDPLQWPATEEHSWPVLDPELIDWELTILSLSTTSQPPQLLSPPVSSPLPIDPRYSTDPGEEHPDKNTIALKPQVLGTFSPAEDPLEKLPYTRRRKRCHRPRVQCSECNSNFRSTCELERHMKLRHPIGVRKVWICYDVRGDGTALASCKHCRSGKRYKRPDNAAAQ